jgi:hypothetical protein
MRPREAPGSPCSPSPSSISPGASREEGGCPGSVHVEKLHPMVPSRAGAAAAAARAATSDSAAPAAAAAPASLMTSAQPARPRRPTAGFPGSAQSSATTTMATARPSALARSAAAPNASRSPV